MQTRPLGTSGIDVSTVALGCMSLCGTGTFPDIPEPQAHATVHAALDHGVTFFDTAPAYGNGESERRLGVALQGRRDRAVVATKISSPTLTAADVQRELDQSLQRLRTDYVDLYQIHWPRQDTPIDETMRAMDDLLRTGKARAIGVCNFGPLDLADALRHAPALASNQIAYSLLARGPEYEAIPLAESHHVATLCYSPLAQGLLTGVYANADAVPADRAFTRHFASTRPKTRHGQPGLEQQTFAATAHVRRIAEELNRPMADVAVAWLLHRPTVASVLTGASRPDQIARNAAAANLTLSADLVRHLNEATEEVKTGLGRNLDLWQSDSRIR